MKLWVINDWEYGIPCRAFYFLSKENAMNALHQKILEEPFCDWCWDEIETED